MPDVSMDDPIRALWPEKFTANGTRAYNRLRLAHRGITVGGLLRLTAGDVLDIRQAGPQVLAEIRRVLAVHGLALSGEEDPECGERVRRLVDAGLTAKAAQAFADGPWPCGEIAPGIVVEVTG